MNIAVLEDSAALAELLRTGLGIRGHIVHTFSKARPFIEAVCTAGQAHVDALICDMGFDSSEEDSGVKAIAQIRTVIPDMPAVIISGLDIPELLAIERQFGNVPAIQKPFNLQLLETTIRKLVYGPTQ